VPSWYCNHENDLGVTFPTASFSCGYCFQVTILGKLRDNHLLAVNYRPFGEEVHYHLFLRRALCTQERFGI
jgi:hypothetical protein